MATCGAPVRGFVGELCQLPTGHRGHHSCSTAYCEGCGQRRRASQVNTYPLSYGEDPEHVALCWFCANVRTQREPEYINE